MKKISLVLILLLITLAALTFTACEGDVCKTHTYGAWQVTKAPTCTTTGTEARTCTKCDEMETRTVDPIAHAYGEWVTVTPATCEGEGKEERACAACGAKEERPVVALDHDTVEHAAQAPTCTAIGWDAYVTCSRCDYTTYAEKAALGHDEVARAAQAPTCTVIGWDAYVTCSRCDYTTYEEKAALGHDEVTHAAQAPTCTAIGWDAYVTCTRCDYTTYAEKAALGHAYDTAWSYDANTHYHRCTRTGCEAKADEAAHAYDGELDADCNVCGAVRVTHCSHPTTEVLPGYAATCTAPGMTEGLACTACGETLTERQPIDALGHDEINHNAQAPTCTAIGWDVYVTCSRCDYTTYTEKAALGHDEVTHAAQAPTCTAIGWDAYVTCTRCDYTTYVEIPATGHNITPGWIMQEDKHWHPCTNDGCEERRNEGAHVYTDDFDTNCNTCGYIREVAACTHPTTSPVQGYSATCTQPGLTDGAICAVCGETVVTRQMIPALGHDWVSVTYPTVVDCRYQGCYDMVTDACTRCDAEIIRPGQGHIESEWVIGTPATCTTPGNRYTYCLRGHNRLQEEEIPALTHSYATTWSYDNDTHYHACTREGCGSHGDEGLHTPNATGLCTVCGHQGMPVETDLSFFSFVPVTGGYAVEYYYGAHTHVTIPATYQGQPIVSIGNGAFRNRTNLVSISIPETVTSIGDEAFMRCSLLERIYIPSAVRYLGAWAFYECTALQQVTFGEGCQLDSIESNVFAYTAITEIDLPEHITIIAGNAFYSCGELTTIEIPASVTTIGECAFGFCQKLETITFAANSRLEVICGMAFQYCINLTSMVLPEGLTTINVGAFEGCASLQSIRIPASVTSLEGGYTFRGCSVLESVTFADGTQLTAIPQGMFFDCVALTSFVIPESVTEIGNYAFSGCTALTTIRIPAAVTGIECYAFADCIGLSSITFAHQVGWYMAKNEGAAFGIDIVVSDTAQNVRYLVTQYSDYYYYMKTPSCAAGHDEIPHDAQAPTCTEIGWDAYVTCSRCDYSTYVEKAALGHIPGTAWLYDDSVHYHVCTRDGCGVRSGEGLHTLNATGLCTVCGHQGTPVETDPSHFTWTAIEGGYELTKYNRNAAIVVIPATYNGQPVIRIGTSAFNDRSGLTHVIIPAGMVEIGNFAFSSCENLVTVEIPVGVTTIGEKAFFLCDKLADVTIPAGVITIGNSAFSGCKSLLSISIPASVTTMGDSVFYNCASLASVEILANITDLAPYMFNGCTLLSSVTLPNGLVSIGSYAFNTCTSLAHISIPANVTDIGDYAFYGCASLADITIPEKVTSIGIYAFCGCSALTSVSFESKTGWYVTRTEGATSGTSLTVTDTTQNVNYFVSMYQRCYWYKVEGCAHDLTQHAAQAPTCTEIGWDAYETCSLCDYTTYVEIPATGHNFTPGWIMREDKHWHPCTNDGCEERRNEGAHVYTDDFDTNCNTCGYIREVAACTHPTTEPITGYPATCTEPGLTDGATCTVCGETATAQVPITALGHGEIPHDAQAPTCTEIGWDAYVTCSRCDYSTYVEKAALGHDWEYTTNLPANCLYGIHDGEVCTRCGIENPSFVPTINDGNKDSNNHNWEYKTDLPANCTYGIHNGYICADCGIEKFDFLPTIDDLNKNPDAHVFDPAYSLYTAPTCTQPGLLRNLCAICFSEIEEVIPALGHHPDFATGWLWDAEEHYYQCQNPLCEGRIEAAPHMPNATGLCTVCGHQGEVSPFTFTKVDGGYTLSGYTGTDANVVIPATYMGEPVIMIGDGVFANCTTMETVFIPACVNAIGDSFRGCTSLFRVEFEENSMLYVIGGDSFSGCTSLFDICIPDNVTAIGDCAFKNCISLGVLPVGENSRLETIGASAFANCTGMSGAIIPNTVTEIGLGAFAGCEALVDIYVPFIGSSAENPAYTHFGYIFGAEDMYSHYNIMPATLWYVYITGGTTIPELSFVGCQYIREVSIPAGVTEICESAFNGCTALRSVTFAEGSVLTEIGSNAFSGCEALKNITLPDRLTTIGASAFECAGLETLTIPASVVEMGEYAFRCFNLKSVTIAADSQLSRIGEYVFMDCESLERINIPANVTSIGVYAFGWCNSIKEVHVTGIAQWCKMLCEGAEASPFFSSPEAVLYVNGSPITDLVIPADVPLINCNVFYGCQTITSLSFEENSYLTEICDGAFAWSGLRRITLPEGLTRIGEFAFTECENLTEIEIRAKETILFNGSYIFTNSPIETITTSLKAIGSFEAMFGGFRNIPSSITTLILTGGDSLNNAITQGAMEGCESLVTLYISAGIPLIDYAAFEGFSALETVIFEEGSNLTGIGAYAFYGCTSLETIEIPAGVEVIGQSTFWNCANLTEVVFAEGSQLKWIEAEAFWNCGELYSITFPEGVREIGALAFAGCVNLRSVTLPENLLIIGADAFASCYNLTAINLGKVQIIGLRAFDGCSALESVDLSSVTELGASAFISCRSLAEITLPLVMTIGDEAFKDCVGLVKVTIGDTVTVIGERVFDNTSVANIHYAGTQEAWNAINKHMYWDNGMGTYTLHCKVDGSEGLVYAKNPDGQSYTVSGIGDCEDTDVIIPASYNGLPVTAIGERAFQNCASIKSVKIPDSVTSIGLAAFYNCTGLESINIPAFVTDIGAWSMASCIGLTSVTIPGNVISIGESAFDQCTSLQTVTFGENSRLTDMGEHAFGGCSILTSIVGFENTKVSTIHAYAFACCSELTGITIPDTVVSIEDYAFDQCGSLVSITFGENSQLETIGNYAFQSSKIASIEIPYGVTTIRDYAFNGCANLASVSFAESCLLTSIGARAFYECTKLENVAFAGCNRLATIGENAFGGCTALTSIEIPQNISEIGYGAFRGCTGLETITLPFVGASKTGTSNTHFGYIFGCYDYNSHNALVPTSLRSVVITNATIIAASAFYGCESLTSITVPDTVESIGESAFGECSSLVTITLPFVGENGTSYLPLVATRFGYVFGTTSQYSSTYKKWLQIYNIPATLQNVIISGGVIAQQAFSEYPNSGTAVVGLNFGGTKVTLLDGVTSLTDLAFDKCKGLTEVEICKNIHSIGAYAFLQCSDLISVKFHADSVVINAQAFKDCTSLASVCGNHLSVGDSAFQGCTSLSSFDVKLIFVGDSAFVHCSSLTEITIPNSVTSIGYRAFEGCTGLTKVHIEDLSSWCTIDFETLQSNPVYFAGKLYLNGGLVTELTNLEGITSIGEYAFGGCTSITSILIPDSVTNIGDHAFYGCSSLESVDFDENIQLTSIGIYTFYACTNLKSVVIPESVTNINNYAFLNCANLTSIHYAGTMEKWNTITKGTDWDYNTGNYTLHCKVDGSEGLVYAKNSDGQSYTVSEIGTCSDANVKIPASYNGLPVTAIRDGAFYNCTSIKSVKIPDSVTSIGNYAFCDCTSLASVTFGENSQLTFIGMGGFAGCTSLASITIPDSVTSIGKAVFGRCTGLENIVVASGNTVYYSKGNCLIQTATKTLIAGCNDSIISSDESVTSIGSYAFSGYTSLTSITIPASVTSIGDCAFGDCTSLASVTFGENSQLTSIGDGAFLDCTSLANIAIPAGVSAIGENVFLRCSALTDIYYAETMTKWNAIVKGNGWDAGTGDYTLHCKLDGSEGLVYTKNADGQSYTVSEIGTCSDANVKIPASYNGLPVTAIGDYVFQNCKGITSVEIPASVTSIGEYVFAGCANLASVTLAEGTGLTTIGYRSFENCFALTSMVIPDTITSIGSFAFYRCTALETVTIGINSRLTAISSYTFASCESLKSIYIPAGVTVIDNAAFNLCKSLERVTFAQNGRLARINQMAFEWCSALPSITIPDTVTDIGGISFRNCKSLVSITIPANVTSIGRYVFLDATALTSVTFENIYGWYLTPTQLATEGTYVNVMDAAQNASRFKDTYVDHFWYSTGICAHDLTRYAAQAPTCTTIGWDAYTVCSLCDHNTYVEKPAIGSHNEVPHAAQAPTCTEIGWEAYVTCSRCDYTTYVEIPARHQYSETVVPPTKTEEGYTLHTCPGCGDSYKTDVLPATGSLGLAYTLNSDGQSYSVSKGTCTDADVVILAAYEGLPVTSIADSAFMNCGTVENIVIPDSVISIDCLAFFNCKNLKSVTFGENSQLAHIESEAFGSCASLMSIKIPASVTSINNGAFWGCTGLQDVYITDVGVWLNMATPSDIERGYYGRLHILDANGNEVTKVVIPDGVTCIGHHVFAGCTNLVSIEIPGSVTDIGSGAFFGCTSLTSIEIPDSVTDIGSGTLSGCTSLTSITIPFVGGFDADWNSHFGHVFGAYDYDSNNDYVPSSLKNVVITGGDSIGERAFYGCKNLVSISIPASVTSIGTGAFEGCTSLASVTFENIYGWSVIDVDNISSNVNVMDAAKNADWLTEAYSTYGWYSTGVCAHDLTNHAAQAPTCTEIGWDAYAVCSLCDYNTYVEKPAFGSHDEIPHGAQAATCTEIGWEAYVTCSRCHYTTYVEIPARHQYSETVVPPTKTEEGYTLHACPGCGDSYKTDVLPATGSLGLAYTLNSDGQSYAVSKGTCTDPDVVIPENYNGLPVTSIGHGAFSDCTSLASITIPDSVISIDARAFHGCTSLANAEIHANVTSIGDYAFYGCTSLTSVTFAANNQLTSIGEEAFRGCTRLASVILGENSQLTNIGEYAFYGCASLASVVIPSGVTSVSSGMFSGCESLASISIPSGATSIESFAFQGCTSLESIEIPLGVTGIGVSAFDGCLSLVRVMFCANSQLTSIGSSAFEGCTNMTSIEIPSSVTSINNFAFYGCTNLACVTFCPNSRLISIGNFAFAKCTSLAGISFGENSQLMSIDIQAFENCTSLASVTFGQNSQLVSIGNAAFKNCTNLARVTFGKNSQLTSINYQAFYGCTRLASVTFGANSRLVSIDSQVFYNCTSLESIEIPASVTSIGELAFWKCTNLTSVTFGTNSQLVSIGAGAFMNCTGLASIQYGNSKAGWNAITKGTRWNDTTGNYTIYCSDGNIAKS